MPYGKNRTLAATNKAADWVQPLCSFSNGVWCASRKSPDTCERRLYRAFSSALQRILTAKKLVAFCQSLCKFCTVLSPKHEFCNSLSYCQLHQKSSKSFLLFGANSVWSICLRQSTFLLNVFADFLLLSADTLFWELQNLSNGRTATVA